MKKFIKVKLNNNLSIIIEQSRLSGILISSDYWVRFTNAKSPLKDIDVGEINNCKFYTLKWIG